MQQSREGQSRPERCLCLRTVLWGTQWGQLDDPSRPGAAVVRDPPVERGVPPTAAGRGRARAPFGVSAPLPSNYSAIP
jgi:nitrogen fixation-related uncharacterized protein